MTPLINFALRVLSRNRLSVFLFHAVPHTSPEIPREFTLGQFEEMLHFIRRHFNVIPLSDAVNAMKNGKLSARTACITFDDGYPCWISGVAPLLKKANLHATFYITTGQFKGLPMWHERVARAIVGFKGQSLDIIGFGLPPLPMHGLKQRSEAFSIVEQFLKYQTVEVRETLLLMLEMQAGVLAGEVPCMNESQLKELAAMGFGIGAHTHSHPILSLCNRQQAVTEIGSVREILSGMLKCKVESFAYPNGRPGTDFNSEHVEIVKSAGYLNAVTTDWGAANPNTSPFEIPRFTPWGPSKARMALQMARNMLIQPREVGISLTKKPPNVLVVENGAGFGGAVIALKSLIASVDITQANFCVISNINMDGLEKLAAVREVKVISDRGFDTREWARNVKAVAPAAFQPMLLFSLGRLDDVFNRLPYFVKLAWYAMKVKPDIVHGNNEPSSNREAMLVAKLFRIPFVQHVRGALAPTRMTSWLLTSPAAFVPVSRWLAGDLLIKGVQGHRIRQVYDGVDMCTNTVDPLPNLKAELKVEPHTILVAMIGMLVQWKGQDLFIDAVSKIQSLPSNIVFLIFGDTPDHGDKRYAEKLQEKVIALGLQKKVIFMGLRTDLKRLLPQIAVVVSASTEPEPLGLVMIEAMANGCSFIAPAFGAATEVVEDEVTGYLFTPRDTLSLSVTLHKAIVRYEEDGKLSQLAKRRVEKAFSPEQCRDQTIQTYKTILEAEVSA